MVFSRYGLRWGLASQPLEKHGNSSRNSREEESDKGCSSKKCYKERNKIERAFAKLKGWRRVEHRYGRCPEIFLSACAFVAIAIWWV